MYRYCIAVLCLLFSVALAHAADLTLNDAIAAALARQPELQAAREQIAAATGRALQGRKWPNPELELSAEDVPIDDGGLSRSKNLIGVSQTVPFPGKQSLDANIGSKDVSAIEWEYRSKEIELVREVTKAFSIALAAEKKVAVSEQLLELVRDLADASTKRVAAGGAADHERLRAEIELERANVELAAARRDGNEAQRKLATLMGQAREPVGRLLGDMRESAELPVHEQACAQMLTRHPSLRAAAVGQQRAQLELRRAKLEPLPDVTVGVAGGRDTGANETLMEFRLSLPLPLFDRAQGKKKEARALAEIVRYDVAATEQRLIQELEIAEAKLRTAGEQVETYRTRILPKAEEALRLVRGGFEAGKFGFLDLVDTQRTLAEARLAYLDKLLELNLAHADLEALAGTQTKE